MLFQRPGASRLERIQGAFISDKEVMELVSSVKNNTNVNYDQHTITWIESEQARLNESQDGDEDFLNVEDEPKFDLAVQLAMNHGAVSASFLQRHLKIGYNRAARIVESMESQGMVDKAEGAKPRRWLGPTRRMGVENDF
jgi:S-DNA-T family DNA segregation ATPase FtsK/SpoIIIE